MARLKESCCEGEGSDRIDGLDDGVSIVAIILAMQSGLSGLLEDLEAGIVLDQNLPGYSVHADVPAGAAKTVYRPARNDFSAFQTFVKNVPGDRISIARIELQIIFHYGLVP